MTWVLGVDPGVISGWALLSPSGQPRAWGQTGKPGTRGTGLDVHEVLKKCGPLCHDWPPLLCIEGQFISPTAGKGQGERHKAVATLITARHAGIWIGVCERYGLPVHLHKGKEPGIPPNAWRGGIWGGRWSEKEAKEHAVKLAADTWGIRVLKTHHHCAEAMWIGRYVQKELEKQARRERQGGMGW